MDMPKDLQRKEWKWIILRWKGWRTTCKKKL
jgi:hypothetical protein